MGKLPWAKMTFVINGMKSPQAEEKKALYKTTSLTPSCVSQKLISRAIA